MIENILQVVEPGEWVSYSELLERMKKKALNTNGIGLFLHGYDDRHFHSHEIVTWREPTWDAEVEGGWTKGTLWIKRKPRDAT